MGMIGEVELKKLTLYVQDKVLAVVMMTCETFHENTIVSLSQSRD